MANPFDLRTILLAKHPQHVVLIRFPIALFITGVGLDLLSPGNRASQLAAAAYLNISIAAAAMIPAALAGMLGLAIRTRWKEAKRHSVVPRRCSFDCRGVAPDVVVGTLAVTQIGIASAPETSHPSRIVRRGSHRAHRAPGRVSYRSELLIAGTPKVTLLSFFCHAGNIPAPSEVRTIADQFSKSEPEMIGALTMKEEKETLSSVGAATPSSEPNSSLAAEDNVRRHWQGVVKRRSFLKGISLAGATLTADALMGKQLSAQSTLSSRRLSKGDVALLRFAAAVELIEADLWQQYNELGGVQGGNPAYIAALSNLDGDMPQYIADNTDDELSHAAFLNAYLISKGAEPVNLDAFRTLPSSQATGAQNVGRLTNLLKLNVDLSWFTRYRSKKNPDLGVHFNGPFKIANEPAIPINDTDAPPDTVIPGASDQTPGSGFTGAAARMQAIANTAGFHFAFIEQGGASLYPTLAFKAKDPEVLRILVSIGGVEIDHFGLWHDKGGNAVAQPLALVTDPVTGLTFPDLNALNSELAQTNLILPEPCDFISKDLPKCSVIRPTTTRNGGAVATIKAFTDDLLFLGQSAGFFNLVNRLAVDADSVPGGF